MSKNSKYVYIHFIGRYPNISKNILSSSVAYGPLEWIHVEQDVIRVKYQNEPSTLELSEQEYTVDTDEQGNQRELFLWTVPNGKSYSQFKIEWWPGFRSKFLKGIPLNTGVSKVRPKRSFD
ncbi:hypothetical protein C4588_01680 [Candidatus Parcubacteria bacterium]|nr:MAG: hypothetical protein C4588_01680 [Candidatus Parcubacteria bacterium]